LDHAVGGPDVGRDDLGTADGERDDPVPSTVSFSPLRVVS
jgi:hypothetical protein